MRTKTNNLKMLFVAMLCCLGFVAFLAMPLSLSASAHSHDCDSGKECHEVKGHDFAKKDLV